MGFLREEDLFAGSVVRLEDFGVFEGFVLLLEKSGEPMTYMEEEDNIIYGKCRWLVEWADLPDDFIKDPKARITQKIMCGKRTHRFIRYIAGTVSWETYAKENGPLKERTYLKKPIDDSNYIF